MLNEEKLIKKWNKRRKKGVIYFALTEGLSFGVITIVLLKISLYLIKDEKPFELNIDQIFYLALQVLITAVIYTAIFWPLNTYIYHKYKQRCKK